MLESAKTSFVIFVCFVLAASTLLVFWQVRNFGFVNYDDDTYVYENPHVLTGLTSDNVIWAFTTGHSANWHPLTWLSLMLDCRLFGSSPVAMHLVNVLLHIVNTLLLFTVLRKITGSLWSSAFVAAAFAIHPAHVESVAWIAERKDVLSTAFWMLTLLAYVGYVKKPRASRYLLTILLFAFGLMTKPMLVTLPLVLLLLDYWPLNRIDSLASFYKAVVEKIPLFVFSVVFGIITFLVQRAGGTVADIADVPFKGRLANAFLSYIEYIGKMFWPINLAVFYPLHYRSITFLHAALSALLLLAVSALVIRLGKNQKYLVVGWFWFVVTLIPVIGLVQVGSQALADRYTYIPYIGLFVMIAWGIPELLSKLASSAANWWPYRKIALGLSMVIVLTALGMCAFRQVSYWNNSTALFSHALDVTQNNDLAHFNLGGALMLQGKRDAAFDHFKRSLEINPNNSSAKNNVAWILATSPDPNVRNTSEAIRLAQEACNTTNYKEASVLDTLAAAYASAGRFTEAVDTARKAVTLAEISNNPQIKNILEYHLSFYTQGKPYIEAPPTLPAEPNKS